MRTWMLAPDGYWSEVTAKVAGCGDDPTGWTWPDVVEQIGHVEVRSVMVVDRDGLVNVHGSVSDRWVANRVWDTACTRGVDYVTTASIRPLDWASWLASSTAFAGRPNVGTPHYAWADRRCKWLLMAHSDEPDAPDLDGAYLAVGATRAAR